MIKNFTVDPRALPLLLGLMLIGGTACFSMHVATPEELAANHARQEELQRIQLEKIERDASAGNPAAITSLANNYLFGYYGLARDTAKGKELLERATAAGYTPAQIELGWLLLAGRTSRASSQVGGAQSLHEPIRGMALLKAALAGTTCAPNRTPRPVQGSAYYRVDAENDIAEAYRAGKLLPQDIEQANLWLARSLVHCQYPTAAMLAMPERYGIVAGPADRLAWLLLLPPSPQLEAARSTASPEDLQAAGEKATGLRQAVRESETQFPAPH